MVCMCTHTHGGTVCLAAANLRTRWLNVPLQIVQYGQVWLGVWLAGGWRPKPHAVGVQPHCNAKPAGAMW